MHRLIFLLALSACATAAPKPAPVAAAADPAKARYKARYEEATAHALANDFEAAAQSLLQGVAEVGARPDLAIEFWAHNTLMMLREAQGDVTGALVECDEMTLSGLRGTWATADPTLVWMKEHWHRAYLLRMLAERLTGPRREATLRYAEAARARYTAMARDQPDFQDSIAVLEGYFAALDGDAARALAAARRVNVKENGDVEDLYLTVIAFDAGGDAAAAEAVRQKIRSSGDRYLAWPIMNGWLEGDQRAGSGRPRFSPRHPTGD